MSEIKPDSESLMALHALLKFRSDSFVEAEQFRISSAKVTASPTAKDSVTSRRSNDTKKAKALAPKQTSKCQVLAVTPSPILSGQPISLITPSPPFAPMLHPPPLAQSFSQNHGIQKNANLASVSLFPMVTDPIKLDVTPNLSLQTSDLNEKTLDGKSQGKRLRAKGSTKEDEESAAAAKAIRTAEIEAALRSKPQRGRKRDNLSALERLELTRTRNREHAKTTRERKKARYQELLDNEQKYEELTVMQELCRQRQECVRSFLSIRESMLRTCLVELEPSVKCKDETSLEEPRVLQGFVSPTHRVVTFLESNAPSHDESRAAPSLQDIAERSKSLSELIDNDADFEFKTVGGTVLDASSSGSNQKAAQTQATSVMSMFDRSLAAKVGETMGNSFVGRLSYALAEGGVAVNDKGTGFAEVHVTTHNHGHQRMHLVSGILRLRFAPDSEKLKSVIWHITKEWFDQDAHDARDGEILSSNESLGCQTSYPSVVSLDPIIGGDLSSEI